jgi:integrase
LNSVRGAGSPRTCGEVFAAFLTHCARRVQVFHADWGPAQGNYDAFRMFTGLRPSEQIALTVSDFDASRGTLTINKARVGGIDKNSTKTGADRRPVSK